MSIVERASWWWKTAKDRCKELTKKARPYVFDVAGLGCFTTAGFYVHLVAGLIVAGLSLLIIQRLPEWRTK